MQYSYKYIAIAIYVATTSYECVHVWGETKKLYSYMYHELWYGM